MDLNTHLKYPVVRLRPLNQSQPPPVTPTGRTGNNLHGHYPPAIGTKSANLPLSPANGVKPMGPKGHLIDIFV